METVHIALRLGRDGPELEADRAVNDALPQLGQTLDTNVLQGVLDTSHEVWHELGDRAAVEHGTGDTLGNEQLVALREVAGSTGIAGLGVVGVGGANTGLLVLHGVDGAHTAVGLDELALAGDEVLTWRLGGTGEETAHHDGGGAEGETLDDVANVLNTTVGDTWNAEACSESGDAVDRCGLWATDGHDLLGNAGRAGAHTDTQTVDTSLDEGGSLLTGNDIATNDIQAWVGGLDVADHIQLEDRVTLGRVEDDNVKASLNKLGQTLAVIWAGTDGGSSDQLLGLWQLGGKGVVDVLHQVGAGEEGDKVVVLVDNWELALLRLGEDGVGLGESDASLSSDKVGGHGLGDRVGGIIVELEITRSDDTNKLGAKGAVLCVGH